MKLIKIKEEHYRAPLSWVIGTEQEFFKHLDNNDIVYDLHSGCVGHFITQKGYSVLWVSPNLSPDEFLRTLNHELLHYCIGTLHRKGIPISYENEESIAYFQENMLAKCMAVNITKFLKT